MPQRFLIIRLSAIGDTILNIPVLCALRKHFPNATIGWVCESAAARVLRGHEDLDELFELTKATQRSPSQYISFLKRIRAWKPDVVIDAQGLTKSAMIGWVSGAKQRIGFSSSEFEGRELSTWVNNILVTPQQSHVVLRGLELLRPLGIDEVKPEYRIPCDLAAKNTVERFVQQSFSGSKFAIINVGAGWPSKLWPAARYAAVARHLFDRHQLRTAVLWGGPKEKEIAEEVVRLSKDTGRMAPDTTLAELAEFIRASNLFVGSDTGPMHFAVALGVPTVGIIGPMPIERVGPLGELHQGVQNERLTAAERKHRKTECRPMLSISVEQVTQAVDKVFRASNRESSVAA